MKKRIIAFFAFLILTICFTFGMVGCDNEETVSETSQTLTTKAPARKNMAEMSLSAHILSRYTVMVTALV